MKLTRHSINLIIIANLIICYLAQMHLAVKSDSPLNNLHRFMQKASIKTETFNLKNISHEKINSERNIYYDVDIYTIKGNDPVGYKYDPYTSKIAFEKNIEFYNKGKIVNKMPYTTFMFLDGVLVFDDLSFFLKIKTVDYMDIMNKFRPRIEKFAFNYDTDKFNKYCFFLINHTWMKLDERDKGREFSVMIFCLNPELTEKQVLERFPDDLREKYTKSLSESEDFLSLQQYRLKQNIEIQFFEPHITLEEIQKHSVSSATGGLPNLFTSFSNEGLVMNLDKNHDPTKVRYSFRYDQVIKCRGEHPPEIKKYIKPQITSLFRPDDCCVSYVVDFNNICSMAMFCSTYLKEWKCKTDIKIFRSTMYKRCLIEKTDHIDDKIARIVKDVKGEKETFLNKAAIIFGLRETMDKNMMANLEPKSTLGKILEQIGNKNKSFESIVLSTLKPDCEKVIKKSKEKIKNEQIKRIRRPDTGLELGSQVEEELKYSPGMLSASKVEELQKELCEEYKKLEEFNKRINQSSSTNLQYISNNPFINDKSNLVLDNPNLNRDDNDDNDPNRFYNDKYNDENTPSQLRNFNPYIPKQKDESENAKGDKNSKDPNYNNTKNDQNISNSYDGSNNGAFNRDFSPDLYLNKDRNKFNPINDDHLSLNVIGSDPRRIPTNGSRNEANRGNSALNVFNNPYNNDRYNNNKNPKNNPVNNIDKLPFDYSIPNYSGNLNNKNQKNPTNLKRANSNGFNTQNGISNPNEKNSNGNNFEIGSNNPKYNKYPSINSSKKPFDNHINGNEIEGNDNPNETIQPNINDNDWNSSFDNASLNDNPSAIANNKKGLNKNPALNINKSLNSKGLPIDFFNKNSKLNNLNRPKYTNGFDKNNINGNLNKDINLAEIKNAKLADSLNKIKEEMQKENSNLNNFEKLEIIIQKYPDIKSMLLNNPDAFSNFKADDINELSELTPEDSVRVLRQKIKEQSTFKIKEQSQIKDKFKVSSKNKKNDKKQASEDMGDVPNTFNQGEKDEMESLSQVEKDFSQKSFSPNNNYINKNEIEELPKDVKSQYKDEQDNNTIENRPDEAKPKKNSIKIPNFTGGESKGKNETNDLSNNQNDYSNSIEEEIQNSNPSTKQEDLIGLDDSSKKSIENRSNKSKFKKSNNINDDKNNQKENEISVTKKEENKEHESNINQNNNKIDNEKKRKSNKYNSKENQSNSLNIENDQIINSQQKAKVIFNKNKSESKDFKNHPKENNESNKNSTEEIKQKHFEKDAEINPKHKDVISEGKDISENKGQEASSKAEHKNESQTSDKFNNNESEDANVNIQNAINGKDTVIDNEKMNLLINKDNNNNFPNKAGDFNQISRKNNSNINANEKQSLNIKNNNLNKNKNIENNSIGKSNQKTNKENKGINNNINTYNKANNSNGSKNNHNNTKGFSDKNTNYEKISEENIKTNNKNKEDIDKKKNKSANDIEFPVYSVSVSHQKKNQKPSKPGVIKKNFLSSDESGKIIQIVDSINLE